MRKQRSWVVVIGVLVASLMAVSLYCSGPGAPWLPACLFHRVSGLDCPGCGMTRAAHAALHGRLGEAFRFNPLGMVLLPVAMLGLGVEMAGWVRGKPLPFRFRFGRVWAWGVFGILMVFWVLRNIPSWPFTLLSPP